MTVKTGGTPSLILASASASRTRLLTAAGVPHRVEAAHVDEAAIKESLVAERATAGDIAEILGATKARQVAAGAPGVLVLGADQVLELDGALFDKPGDMDEARRHLLALRGRTHRLWTSASVVRDGRHQWHHTEASALTMRDFTEAFLERYLEEAGEAVLTSVGAYRLEETGAQLFSAVEGNHFAILGLPLLALLPFLRANSIIAA